MWATPPWRRRPDICTDDRSLAVYRSIFGGLEKTKTRFSVSSIDPYPPGTFLKGEPTMPTTTTKKWPLGLDPADPAGIAKFLLGLGYAHDNVAFALVDRCELDPTTANRIVADVAAAMTNEGV
jgi:hypothetical protein